MCLTAQGRRTRRRRNSGASVASHGSHNSGNSASTGSAHYHRPHRSGSSGGGSGGDSGRGPSTTSSSRSGDGRGAKDVPPPHPAAFDDGGLKQLGPFGEEEDTGMALASPWTAAMAQGKNAHAFFPEGKEDDDDAMLTARSSSMGYGMPLGGGSAADCKGVPGAAAGPGSGVGLARHSSNPADHSFGSMGSLGDMDIDHLDQVRPPGPTAPLGESRPLNPSPPPARAPHLTSFSTPPVRSAWTPRTARTRPGARTRTGTSSE